MRNLRSDAIRVLYDERCKKSLFRYFEVFQGNKSAKFKIAKKISADFNKRDKIERLWSLHEKLTEEYYSLEKKLDRRKVKLDGMVSPEKTYLDLKGEIAERILSSCQLCERRDKPDRLKGELGFCQCGSDEIVVSTFFEHMGEEAELVPSGTIFTCGCTLQCLHCQNWTISQHYETGKKYSSESLAKVVERLREGGCRNANLVGGDPTPWLKHWVDVFRSVDVNVPVIWNSNAYYSEEAARLLMGFVDVYLLDYKYGKNECATRISRAPNYVRVCQRNLLYAKKYGEIIIRILLLPSHIDCCAKSILNWIADNLGLNVRVNIMDQYRPEWRAYDVPELRRHLTISEYKTVVNHAKDLGLGNLA
ncbi:MAG: radical SAM protein [Candidatus Bathyarchaeota archaeon]